DGTYYARLTGAGVPRAFDLVITRGADFDTHPNGTFATAQDITGTVGALGAIVPAGSGTSEDWYRVTAQDGQTLFFNTTIPSSGPGQFTNNLQPHIELYDPSGTLVASGVVQADGRNEAITFTVPAGAAGAYRVRVTGKSGTTGEYFLDPVESGGAPRGQALPRPGRGGGPPRAHPPPRRRPGEPQARGPGRPGRLSDPRRGPGRPPRPNLREERRHGRERRGARGHPPHRRRLGES